MTWGNSAPHGRRVREWLALGLGALAAGVAASAAAQDTGPDTVVVTTRKREESLQEVPIAVNAISEQQITSRGLTTLDDITRQTSSVIFQQGFSPQDTKITIRGLSPDRGRVNVAVLLDGVDISGESIQTVGGSLLINPELFEMERVEIVKGPQNALYGRSAYNGAISYITKKPTEQFEAVLSSDVGNFGQARGTARVSGPIIGDRLLGSISGNVYTFDGFYNNGVTGAEVGGREGWGGVGTLLWRPTDGFTAIARISHSDDDYEVQPWAFMNPNRQFAIPTAAINDGITNGCTDADAAGFAGLGGNGSWPTPTTNCVEPIGATVPSVAPGVAAIGNIPGLYNNPALLPLVTGFIPGAAGKFPTARALGNRGTMSEDPYSCTDPQDRTSCRDFAGTDIEVTRGTLDLEWEVGPVTLKSLSHLADASTKQFLDSNDTGSVFDLPFISHGRWFTDTNLFSQELRVTSNGDNRLDWVVGAQYWHEEVDQRDTSSSCIAVFNPNAPNLTTRPLTPCGPVMADIGPNGQFPEALEWWYRDTDHYSAYFLVDWEFAERFNLAVEGRYVREQLDVGGPNGDTTIDPLGLGLNGGAPGTTPPGCVNYDPDGAGPLAPIAASCANPRPLVAPFFTTDEDFPSIDEDDDAFFVPKVTLSWRPTDFTTLYASWAAAAKPSGISALTGGPGAFNPESNAFQREERDVYELGAKTQWLDRRLTVNGAVFYDDYSGKQVSTQVTLPGGLIAPRTVNGGNAEVIGLELEVSMQVTEHLFAGVGYTYLHTEWKDFIQNTRTANAIAYGGNCTLEIVALPDQTTPETGEPDPNNTDPEPRTNCLVDLSGNELTFAPKNSLVGNVAYTRALNATVDWFAEGDFQYQDKRYVNDTNILALDDYWLFNFRAGVTGDRWNALAYVDNALDDDTIKNGIDNIDIRYFGSGFSPNGARALLPDKRTVGIRVGYRFGSR